MLSSHWCTARRGCSCQDAAACEVEACRGAGDTGPPRGIHGDSTKPTDKFVKLKFLSFIKLFSRHFSTMCTTIGSWKLGLEIRKERIFFEGVPV